MIVAVLNLAAASALSAGSPGMNEDSVPDGLPACNMALADSGNQPAMNACAWRDYLLADAELNRVWKDVRDRYPSKREAQALIDTQRAWLKYRDAQCAFERGQFEGGTIAPLIYYSCMKQLTKERTERIKNTTEH